MVRSVGWRFAELESEAPAGVFTLNRRCVAFVCSHSRLRDSAQRFTGGLSARTLRRVLAFISDNYESDLSLAELAGVAEMSTFHFAREFKRTTGTAPHQYLIKFRVERAKSMLTESEIPLVEVSTRSGFSLLALHKPLSQATGTAASRIVLCSAVALRRARDFE